MAFLRFLCMAVLLSGCFSEPNPTDALDTAPQDVLPVDSVDVDTASPDVSCPTGFGDCNNDPGDGCETELVTLAHCGACGEPCQLLGAQSLTCASGICNVETCSTGFGDCDGDRRNNCEPLNTTENCGQCGLTCTFDNATPSCTTSGGQPACDFDCLEGFEDCDGNPANGCEVDTRSDFAHCGACDTPCTGVEGEVVCSDSQCRIGTCGQGTDDCNADPADGCEADLSISTEHCGACSNICTAGFQCVEGSCNGAVEVVRGSGQSCARRGDGTLSCWGRNDYGQLGDASRALLDQPELVSDVEGVVDVAVGGDHTCIVAEDGSVSCWGRNQNLQLGDASGTDSASPVPIEQLTDVTQISAFGDMTCAVQTGQVWCWGYFGFGLGDAAGTARSDVPIAVEGITNALDVSVAQVSACALLDDGGVACWGANTYGSLGHNTPGETSTPTPVAVVGLNDRAVQLASGFWHVCATLADATLQCWGRNHRGFLGDQTTTDAFAPVTVLDDQGQPLSGVTHVSGGVDHTCAVIDGEVWCWGGNTFGQHGDGSRNTHNVPTRTLGLPPTSVDPVVSVSAQQSSTCAVHRSGAISCWGFNGFDELGVANSGSATSPVALTDGGSTLTGLAVALGEHHSCIVSPSQGARCWGSSSVAQLGPGNAEVFQSIPSDVTGIAAADRITAGRNHTCIQDTSGAVSCWGFNGFMQLGSGLDALSVTDLDAGGDHTCAVSGQDAICWGRGLAGELGVGFASSATPITVPEFGASNPAVLVAAGGNHSCAAATNNEVRCWGQIMRGQAGQTPRQPVTGIPAATPILDLAAGEAFSCAATNAGVYCWGANDLQQLGRGAGPDRNTAFKVDNVPNAIASLAAGWNHACAVTMTGALWCWGQNSFGQLGFGTRLPPPSLDPVEVFPTNVAKVSCGRYHTCVTMTDDVVQCWGQNVYGQVGTAIPIATSPQNTLGQR